MLDQQSPSPSGLYLPPSLWTPRPRRAPAIIIPRLRVPKIRAAFPTIVDSILTSTSGASSTAAPVINFPTTTPVAASDLIIAGLVGDNANSVTNWGASGGTLTQLRNANFNSNAAFYGIGARLCSANDSSVTLAWTSERYAAFAIKIGAGTFHNSGNLTDSSMIRLSTGTEQSGTGPDPDNLDVTSGTSWGADDILWIALHFQDTALTSVTTWPTNYGSNQTTVDQASGGGIALATRTLNASAENPGAWLLSGSKATFALTIAIRPAQVPWWLYGRQLTEAS